MATQRLTRRRFLFVSGGVVALAGCGASRGAGVASVADTTTRGRTLVLPTDPAVIAAERARGGGAVVRAELVANRIEVDLGGRVVSTWAYGDTIGGPPLRVTAGEQLDVLVRNRLPDPTSIHWHGLALRNDMDGVPDVTQLAIEAGGEFRYQFTVPDSGTYWFHPHSGTQLDRGLYAPLIVDDPGDAGQYDAEAIVVLDDWLDGFGTTPDDVLAELRSMGMGGMGGMGGPGGMGGMQGMGGQAGAARALPAGLVAATQTQDSRVGAAMGEFSSDRLGGDAGDVAYPLHLINGKPPADRPTFTVPPGGRVRVRLINAGSDTAYRVAVGDHRMTVTHADGFPVVPFDVDSLLIGMGERYDVIVTMASGAWPLVAEAEGKGALASAVIRTSDAGEQAPPPLDTRPLELDREVLRYSQLQAAAGVALADVEPDRTIDLELTSDMTSYAWGINGQPFGSGAPLEVTQGERVRLRFNNRTPMWHPMHLHGHTFALGSGSGAARKDTVNVLPGETIEVDLDANNPGQWMTHCHNTYHLESGMAAVIGYVQG
jgi:FtsP/CotA-like multicopper oxidase with cupredoxin domain